MLPLVAIVGRPNVGKSTLFNRLVGGRRAIVQDDPGVTRDRHYGEADLDGYRVQLVDTGGFVPDAGTEVEGLIRQQAQIAIDEADLLLLVMDARQGLTAEDRDVVQIVRRTGKPVVHVANKVDGPKQEVLLAEFYELGVEQVLGVSAEHALGLDEMLDAMLAQLPPPAQEPADDAEQGVKVALIGRPNAGKSSLFNALVGSDRVIVSSIPGTTRDPVDTRLSSGGQDYVLVDTCGIRRRRTKNSAMERLATFRAFRSVARADVACLVIDAHEGPTEQDSKLASLVEEAGRALVVVLTKSDLFPWDRDNRLRLEDQVASRLGFVSYAPTVRVSSVTKKGLGRILPTVRRVYRSSQQRISTAELNRFLEQALQAHAPPSYHGRAIRFYYVTQAQTQPPTFILNTSAPRGVPASYRRYLLNRLRDAYRFEGAPLRLILRARRKDRGGPGGGRRSKKRRVPAKR